MTTEEAYGIILNEGDHRHRMPRHARATPMSRRDYIRGRLLLMVAKETIGRAEYEAPDDGELPPGTERHASRCRLRG